MRIILPECLSSTVSHRGDQWSCNQEHTLPIEYNSTIAYKSRVHVLETYQMKEVKKQKHTQKVVYENTRLPARIGRSIHSICRRSLKYAYSRKRQSNAHMSPSSYSYGKRSTGVYNKSILSSACLSYMDMCCIFIFSYFHTYEHIRYGRPFVL